jgi:hypothetical protein
VLSGSARRSGVEAAEAQRVGEHRDARERHRGAGDHRREQPAGERVEHAGRDGDPEDVVDEGPEQVLANGRERRPAEAQRGRERRDAAAQELGISGCASTSIRPDLSLVRELNSLPMRGAAGPFSYIDMGGMFTVLKVRDNPTEADKKAWYKHPAGTVAGRADPNRMKQDGIDPKRKSRG